MSRPQYLAQKSQWDSIADVGKGEPCIQIRETEDGKISVLVEGLREKEVGALKVRIESLKAGERLGANYWHEAYGGMGDSELTSGRGVFERIMTETNAFVQLDRRARTLRLFGAGKDLTQAKNIIRQDVERLNLVEHTLPVEAPFVSGFVATGLPILKEALGGDKVRLEIDSRRCNVVLRGGKDAVAYAQTVIEEVINGRVVGHSVRPSGAASSSSCPICFETPIRPEVLVCGHSYCGSCLRHYLSSAATSGKFPLVCLGETATCNVPISIPIIYRYLTQQQFTELVDAVFSHYIRSNSREFKHCTTPDCTRIYRCYTDGRSQRCPACFCRICSSCNEEEHEGMTCEEWRIQRDPVEQDRLNEEWARDHNVKKCPVCGIMTDKTHGCNHMTCRCGTHWDWASQSVMRFGNPLPAQGEANIRRAELERVRFQPYNRVRRNPVEEPEEEGGRIGQRQPLETGLLGRRRREASERGQPDRDRM